MDLDIVIVFALLINWYCFTQFLSLDGFSTETDWIIDPNSIIEDIPVLNELDLSEEEISIRQSRCNQITTKIDSFMLESSLFGALAFSVFLQILLNNP